jgi:hypothetical protein
MLFTIEGILCVLCVCISENYEREELNFINSVIINNTHLILLNVMFFAPKGRFQLELIYLYFPPSIIIDGTAVENKGKLILT